MAELALKIAAGSGYEDGDVLCAFNRRRIRCTHAQHLCFIKSGDRLSDMDADGIMPVDHVSQDWHEATHEYRFERLSQTEAQIVRLADNAVIRFESGKPFIGFDGTTQQMDIEAFVARKRKAQQFPVFGKLGQELWYGGRIDVSDKALDTVWTAIERKTGRREAESTFQFWPAGVQELKSHLFIPVDEFDDVEAEALVAPWIDEKDPENPVMIKKRIVRGNWRSVLSALGTSEADVLDRTKTVDRRRDVEPLKDAGLLHDKKNARPVVRVKT